MYYRERIRCMPPYGTRLPPATRPPSGWEVRLEGFAKVAEKTRAVSHTTHEAKGPDGGQAAEYTYEPCA